mgnify:CR=1 FL=1
MDETADHKKVKSALNYCEYEKEELPSRPESSEKMEKEEAPTWSDSEDEKKKRDEIFAKAVSSVDNFHRESIAEIKEENPN